MGIFEGKTFISHSRKNTGVIPNFNKDSIISSVIIAMTLKQLH